MFDVCGNHPPGTLQTLCVRAGGISDGEMMRRNFFIYLYLPVSGTEHLIYTEQLRICHFRE